MGQRDLFDRIVRAIPAAVLDDALWPACSALIDEACGIKGNMLVFGAGATNDDVVIHLARLLYRGERNEALERLYFRDYYASDERVPRFRALPDSRLVHVGDLYTDEEKRRSRAYNEALPMSHTQDCVSVRMDGPNGPGSRVVWSFADPVEGQGWSFAQTEMIERLLPHLRQYVHVRQALVDARALAATSAGLLANGRLGVVHLDRRGRIVEANDLAWALLRARDGLRDEDGLLRAMLPAEDARLQRLLVEALPVLGGTGAGRSMLVRRSKARFRLTVHVHPVAETKEGPHGTRLGALVILVDPARRSRLDPDRVGPALGLTPSESRVAALLAQGSSIDTVAAEMGRSRTTVKWHVKHIYAKHGLTRQAELAHLVASLADVPQEPD